jgi:transcription termination factor Rho
VVKVTVKSIDVADLQQKRPEELMEMAKQLGIDGIAGMHKQGLIFVISKKLALDHPEIKAAIHGSGVLEILRDGFGFLRSRKMSYLPRRIKENVDSSQNSSWYGRESFNRVLARAFDQYQNQ